MTPGIENLQKVERYFTREEKNPFEFDIFGNPIKYITKDVNITNDLGKVVFTQSSVKYPDFWSDLAIKVVAGKYFWGNQDKKERENSTDMLIGRVAKFFGRQALLQKHFNPEEAKIFEEEIAAICLNQLAAFNSPVWFNAGINEYDKNAGGVSAFKWNETLNKVVSSEKGEDKPQCSACFIQSVDDTMESIMALQTSEANLFKAGSGTGTNYSSLRSSKERLTGGGWASGPISFIKGSDMYAGIIKSGGKTRRAAKMVILNIYHPDIIEFINIKLKEEKKAWALIEQGYDSGMNGEAYASIGFQNCNLSVRASDEFMKAVKENSEFKTKFVKTKETCQTFKARDLLKQIGEATYYCGDPGIQFDDTINRWNTCKKSGWINATNPCSEFIYLDDTACNLASINIGKFRTEHGGFDIERYKETIKDFIIAQELAVDGGSYPTEKITENSHKFRPLGLGYANLGALLMSYGLPYDSDEGRAVAAAITAILTGHAYCISAELAGKLGTFDKFEENRESMLEVIRMHRSYVDKIDARKIPEKLKGLYDEAKNCWDRALELGERYGFRNAQVSVLAPTGTIAFLMDCDTTGIEPDIALVKYKNLSGGGMLKIVNKSVRLALENLGYNLDKIEKILEYINEKETIEGAPGLEEKHLAIFDCAFKPASGKRFIHYTGHIKIMAAVQPFISGGISKTINMPEHCSISEIEEAYFYAWEQGLKSVAIYRENSKRSQPLNTQKTEGEIIKKKGDKANIRRTKLPQTRKSIVHKFDIAGHEGYFIVGLYDNGRPGEIFVTMHKEGSTIRGLMDSWATSVSLNLQYGASVNDLFKKFRHQKFEPSGFVKNENGGDLDFNRNQIRTASSIVDYVAQFMLNNFGEGAGGINVEVSTAASVESEKEEQKSIEDFGNEGIICPHCGGPAKRIGNCAIYCTSCKQTTRSGCGE